MSQDEKVSLVQEEIACTICSISYTSQQELADHSWSLIHHIKLSEKSKKSIHTCTLCHVPCTSLSAYSQHLTGKRHRQAVKAGSDIATSTTSYDIFDKDEKHSFNKLSGKSDRKHVDPPDKKCLGKKGKKSQIKKGAGMCDPYRPSRKWEAGHDPHCADMSWRGNPPHALLPNPRGGWRGDTSQHGKDDVYRYHGHPPWKQFNDQYHEFTGDCHGENQPRNQSFHDHSNSWHPRFPPDRDSNNPAHSREDADFGMGISQFSFPMYNANLRWGDPGPGGPRIRWHHQRQSSWVDGEDTNQHAKHNQHTPNLTKGDRPISASFDASRVTERMAGSPEKEVSPSSKDAVSINISLKASKIIDDILNKATKDNAAVGLSPTCDKVPLVNIAPRQPLPKEQDKGAYLLKRAENLCRELREKREHSRVDQMEQKKKKKKQKAASATLR